MEYDVTIGIEIHCQLKTNTKMFSGAPTSFGRKANTCVNEVDLGHPGSMPQVNEEAVRKAVMACTALHLTVDPLIKFDRKNYYYSDLPKGFQITQQFHPIGRDGYVDIDTAEGPKKIRIERIHMEEDTAKQFHLNKITLLDYNRAGTPLIELVSKPDMHNGAEAEAYVEALRQTLYYIGVSDCKMEEGSLRCDANISIRPEGTEALGTKSEIKNMNSFKAVQRGLEYEVARQTALVEDGDKVIQETRRWDDTRGMTFSMRTKEEANDYRYFPDPDLAPIMVSTERIAEIAASLPELPEQTFNRLVEQDGLSEYDAGVITATKAMADYYDQCVGLFNNPKMISNWIMGDFSYLLNDSGIEIQDAKVTPQLLADMLKMIDSGKISGKIAKVVFEEMFASGKTPETIVQEKGLVQISDVSAIEPIAQKVIDANPKSVEDWHAGKDKAIGFLVGQIMKETKGKANPQVVNEIILKLLGK